MPKATRTSLGTFAQCRMILLLLLCICAVASSVAAFARASSQRHSFSGAYDHLIQWSVARWWGDYPDWKSLKAQFYQESQLDPNATSPVGAKGIAQFMPATWLDVERRLGMSGTNPREARYAIDYGAYYMASLRAQWTAKRPVYERQRLAWASYNTGTGNVLRAQALCDGALLWDDMARCLPTVTGRDAQQTIWYVHVIPELRKELGD